MNSRYHQLFSGELHDAPGRAESWTEYVRYLGDSRWELINEGSDYEGTEPVKASTERLGTKALLLRILQRDADELDNVSRKLRFVPIQNEDEDELPQIGPRATRLFEIAKVEGATFCLECLNGWFEGRWPKPTRLPPAPKICCIKGVTKRGIWLGVYRAVFSIETTLGAAYLEPPQKNGVSSLRLVTSGSSDRGWPVRLTNQQMAEIEKFAPSLNALKESINTPCTGRRFGL